MNENRYQITERTGDFGFAGSKAPADVSTIAEKLDFAPVSIVMRTTEKSRLAKVQRQIGFAIDWSRAIRSIHAPSLLLLQFPFHYPQLTRETALQTIRRKNGLSVIGLVHDVEELRGYRYSDYYRREFAFMLDYADVLIVHNDRMKQFFLERGVSKDRLVVLQIFDYLLDPASITAQNKKKITFERSLNIAGNLSARKSGYLRELTELPDITLHLYGAGPDKSMQDKKNVVYHGMFAPEKLPDVISSGFGLVWDGETIQGCSGAAGNYLRYNNPHKLSLYLASGIPVVIWKEAAEAAFVEQNHLGITVNSVQEATERILAMTPDQYVFFAEQVQKVAAKLREGDYTRQALEEAIAICRSQATALR